MIYVLDERLIWHEAIIAAAKRAGHQGKRVFSGETFADAKPGDIGFLRPHADWRRLPDNRRDYSRMLEAGLLTIQDQGQVDCYESKREQWRRWGAWMPKTFVGSDEEAAHAWVEHHEQYPIVSKADVGASSVNVRILQNEKQAHDHIRQLWDKGVRQQHGASCPDTMQQGYAILQEFIPHKITYRVNAIGDARAIFFRYCYPDRPVAQTGNVDPAYELDDKLESLMEYADVVFADIGTKWCALDILESRDGWKLLESSLAWPWPSPGDCDNGTIFRSGGKKWIQMFDVMMDELERGAWSVGH
jgi:biotin carboxylase